MKRALIVVAVVVLLAAVAAAALLWFGTRMPGATPGVEVRPPADVAPPAMSRLDRISSSVIFLADRIGERNLAHPGSLDRAAEWIERQFQTARLETRTLPYDVNGTTVKNVEAQLPGTKKDAGTLVVGAHYDSVEGAPGANDNATGAAALLELARELGARGPLPRTVRFVAFANEEPPYFQTDAMGSLVYARHLTEAGERIFAMVSLESLGCYSNAQKSQHYPPLVGLAYPDTGNFVAFVGDVTSRALVQRAIGTFRASCDVPAEGGAFPGALPGIGWSDHWSFWQVGVPALMVTDTAVFRDAHYHTQDDVYEHVDFATLDRVVGGLIPVLEDLATRGSLD